VITAEKVRVICGRYQITNPGSLEGLGFRACYSTSAESPTALFWKPNVLGNYRKVLPLRWTINHFTFKPVIVSLLEHNLNQRISYFRSFNSACKVNIDESFFHLRLNLT